MEDNSILMLILCVVYVVIGTKSIKYIKTNIFGITAVFTSNILDYFVKQVLIGILLGWIAAPIALIHWIFIGRNR